MTREKFIEIGNRNADMDGFTLYGRSLDINDMEELRASVRILARLLHDARAELAPY
jgi:hypothetical protein